jgi:hypothetical protein
MIVVTTIAEYQCQNEAEYQFMANYLASCAENNDWTILYYSGDYKVTLQRRSNLDGSSL